MIILALYVDDLIVAATTMALVNHIKDKLIKHFKMKQLGSLDLLPRGANPQAQRLGDNFSVLGQICK